MMTTRIPSIDLQAFMRMVKFGDTLIRTEPLASLVVLEPPRTDDEFEKLVVIFFLVQY